jgi:hypothetical protein
MKHNRLIEYRMWKNSPARRFRYNWRLAFVLGKPLMSLHTALYMNVTS